MRKMIISIEGNIGSGKSTCINTLQTLSDWGPVMSEPLSEWENWLPDLYAGVPVHFQVQTLVLLAYASFRNISDGIIERSPLTALRVFIRQAVAQGDLTERDIKALGKLFDVVGWSPDVVIYIKTTPDTCMRRIKQRNRPGEHNISLQLLQDLHEVHNDFCEHFEKEVIVIDGNQPIRQVVVDVLQALNRLLPRTSE